MFNIFKKKAKDTREEYDILIMENELTEAWPVTKTPDTSIIKEIHDSFYGEMNLLREYCTNRDSEESVLPDLLRKAERLKALGFKQSQECEEALKEIKRIESIRTDNIEKERMARAIFYFQTKYPNYKFINKDSIMKLCEKYGLVFGSISRYKGSIPEKNIKEMETFKIAEEDQCYYEVEGGLIMRSMRIRDPKYFSFEEYQIRNTEYEALMFENIWKAINSKRLLPCSRCIVANKKDMDTSGGFVIGYEIFDIPDPVVCHPVFFDKQQYFLIETAWGDEASDSMVLNEKLN